MWISLSIGVLLSQAPPPPAASQPDPRPEELASIAGKVVNKLTREPVKNADVVLRSGDAASEAIRANSDGTFFVDQLRPGRYTLEARKNGFTFPRRKAGAPIEFVALEKGAKKTGHTLELLPQATISGRVTDEHGEPVASAVVAVELAKGVPFGMMRPAQTDDKGTYRLFGLEPGKYRVRVTPANTMMMEQPSRGAKPMRIRPAASVAEGMVPVYFPAATTADQAAVVELAAGDEREGVDIQMVKARVFEISGKVIPAPGWTFDNPNRTMMGSVYLMSSNRMQFNMGGTGMIDSSGRFSIKNVAPGSYTMIANLAGSRTASRLKVDVLGSDVTNLEAVFHSPVSLTGTLKTPAKMDPSKVRISMQAVDGMGGGSAQGSVDAKGAFKLDNVAPDTMVLRVMGLDPAAFVQSVRIDGQDVEPDSIPVRPGEGSQLEITIADNGGSLEGIVRSANDAEHENAAVILWPNGETNAPVRPSLVRVVRSGAKGKFEIPGVRPGRYLLVALDTFVPANFSGTPDDETLRKARAKAISIQVDSGSRITQDLKSLAEPE